MTEVWGLVHVPDGLDGKGASENQVWMADADLVRKVADLVGFQG
jgi:hypothetical protein